MKKLKANIILNVNKFQSISSQERNKARVLFCLLFNKTDS